MIPKRDICTRARAPTASGRRVSGMRDVFVALVLSCLVVACSTVGGDPAAAPGGPADPPIRVEEGGPREDATAEQLLRDAWTALDAGDPVRAEELARQVVRAHAAAEGSGGALRILARALHAQERFGEVDAVVQRFAGLLPSSDDRVVELRLLAGSAAAADGRAVDALAYWLSVSSEAAPRLLDDARLRIEQEVAGLSREQLESLEDRFARGELIGPVLARLSLEQYLAGDRSAAGATANRAIQAGVSGDFERMASGVLAGDVSEFAFQPRLGVVLPSTGSPRLRALAEEISQGIQVALVEFGQAEGNRMAVELLERDNRGAGGSGVALLAELEADGALGLIGPLQEGLLDEFAAARTSALPIVSPTATSVPSGQADVYSLQGAEEGAARAIAEYALDRAIETAVLIYPDIPDARREATAFRDAFGAEGGTILGEFPYPDGATYFAEQLRSAARLGPDVLVFPVPAADVELLAPQVTFFGLDSLGVQLLGTSGWTDPGILGRVDDRHTNGVVAASPQPPGGGEPEGARAFREAYERLFQNTLRSSVPQYGYDAALLFLNAVEAGARSPEQVAAAIRNLENVRAATGEFSVRDGRLTRRNYVVCLQDGQARTMPEGERPIWTLFPPLPDPETDSIPPGVPPRIVGFRCPGAPRPPGALDDSVFHPDSAYLDPDTLPVDSMAVDTTMAVDTFFVPSR